MPSTQQFLRALCVRPVVIPGAGHEMFNENEQKAADVKAAILQCVQWTVSNYNPNNRPNRGLQVMQQDYFIKYCLYEIHSGFRIPNPEIADQEILIKYYETKENFLQNFFT